MSKPEDRTRGDQAEQREELAGVVAGPGVVASKSQARGSVAWASAGAIIGAVIGLIAGLISSSGSSGIAIFVIAFAVAGLVAGGVSGGIARPRQKLDGDEADS